MRSISVAVRLLALVCLTGISPVAATGQTVSQSEAAVPPSANTDGAASGQGSAPPHVHDAQLPGTMGLFTAREASGTAWLPDVTPMFGVNAEAGAWQLMAHGSAFVQRLHDGGDRGSQQTGSINWVMGMARRQAGRGRFGLRGMLSLEPWTIRGCGYPDLLASGEVCNGEAIHDRQHPHDLIMEAAAEYDRPVGRLRWQVYGGLGEPALGPAAYPHRFSAFANPIAPISHHWLDATHITFGVLTAGVYGTKWKAEGSLFNGREPDEERTDVDLGSLSSVAARFWYLPRPGIALQFSMGHLDEAEPGHDAGDPRVDVGRITTSATYHRAFGTNGLWGSTLAWGRNREEGTATQALLVESTVSIGDRHAWFGRYEIGSKGGHDLDIHDIEGTFTVAKIQAGYVRYFRRWGSLVPGVGASVSAGLVPAGLLGTYGGRVNGGLAVFVTVRPGGHLMRP